MRVSFYSGVIAVALLASCDKYSAKAIKLSTEVPDQMIDSNLIYAA